MPRRTSQRPYSTDYHVYSLFSYDAAVAKRPSDAHVPVHRYRQHKVNARRAAQHVHSFNDNFLKLENVTGLLNPKDIK